MFELITTILLIFIEVSLKQVSFLRSVSFLFIIVNLLFWSGRFSKAVIIGLISATLIDLMLQEHLGVTVVSLFLPLFFLTVIDNILKIETRLSRLIFSLLSLNLSILIARAFFQFIFLSEKISFADLFSKMLVSSSILLIFFAIFSRLLIDSKGYKFK